jgi:hypothetical protein
MQLPHIRQLKKTLFIIPSAAVKTRMGKVSSSVRRIGRKGAWYRRGEKRDISSSFCFTFNNEIKTSEEG